MEPVNKGENQEPRTKSGQWKKGVSGNPKGKPRGALHKTTMAAMALLEDEAKELTHKAIELAKGGDITALRLCLERLIPPAKDRPLSSTLKLPDNLLEALNVVLQAVNEGDLLPSEGKTLTDILEAKRKAKEIEELERRLDEIEKRLNE